MTSVDYCLWIGGWTGAGAGRAGGRTRSRPCRSAWRPCGPRPLHAFGRAAHIDHGAVAAVHFRIDEAQNQDAAIKTDNLAVLRAARRVAVRTDDSSCRLARP